MSRDAEWSAAVALLLPSCAGDGQISILGYTTRPNYDPNIHTVRVPIFKNITLIRGLEFDLTRAVIREIEAKTPFKVVDSRAGADTELIGKIVSTSKAVITLNQLGEVRGLMRRRRAHRPHFIQIDRHPAPGTLPGGL